MRTSISGHCLPLLASAVAAAPGTQHRTCCCPCPCLFFLFLLPRPIDVATPNGLAWPAAALLRVGAEEFEVKLNPPTVESLSLPGFPLVGYPILPVVALAFAEPAACAWRWLRKPAAAASKGGGGAAAAPAASAAAAGDGWQETGCTDMRYTPSEDDLGCLLCVECTPGTAAAADSGGNGATDATTAAAAAAGGVVTGEPVRAMVGSAVEAGPPQPAARLRALAPGVALAEPWRLRVMSYNILADQYAGTAYAQSVLFGYCPTRLLDNNYRRQLVLEELLRYAVRARPPPGTAGGLLDVLWLRACAWLAAERRGGCACMRLRRQWRATTVAGRHAACMTR